MLGSVANRRCIVGWRWAAIAWLLHSALLAADPPQSAPAAGPPAIAAAPAAPAEVPAERVGKQDPDPAAIQRAIRELGDAKLALREAASQWLWEAGPATEEALRIAATSTDAETRFRARAILEKFRYGVFADTPTEILKAIENFRGGDAKVRQDTIQMLVSRSFDEQAERMLTIEPAAEWLLSVYVTQLSLNGRLDQRLEKMRQQLETDANPNTARVAAMLLRARGKIGEALVIGLKSDDPIFNWSLAMEAGDFVRAADLFDRVRQLPVRASGNPQSDQQRKIELLGFQAVLQQRVGNLERARGTLEELNGLAAQAPPFAWYCMEPFFLAGDVEGGIAAMRKSNPPGCFELLVLQQKYLDALAIAGLKPGEALPERWLNELPLAPQPSGNEEVQLAARFRFAGNIARVLANLGRKQDAERVIAAMVERAEAMRQDALWSLIATTEYRMGWLESAFEHAARTPLQSDRAPVVGAMVGPARAAEAEFWWWYFSVLDPEAPRTSTLQRVQQVLTRTPGQESDARFLELVTAARLRIGQLDANEQNEKLLALADSCLARSDRGHDLAKLGREMLENLASGHSEAALRFADLAAEDSDWERAAQYYQTAWDLNTEKPGLLYLAGVALEKTSRKTDGAQFRERAQQICQTHQARLEMATLLARRQHVEEARQLFLFVHRTAPFDEWAKFDSAKQCGDLLMATDKARAAELWDQMMLSILRISWNFREVDGYLQMPAQIHRLRAMVAVENGDFEQARREAELHAKYLPADIRLAEELLPNLQRANQRPLAEALFQRQWELLAQLCRDFPDSSLHHNNLAWLGARSGENLDEALSHAMRAIELAPRNAGHHDTLAEVQFRRGQREAAIAASRKSLELDPRNKFYQAQLQRFESPPAP